MRHISIKFFNSDYFMSQRTDGGA